MQCPCCGGKGLTLFACYHKYYYSQQILIQRVRCTSCRKTHALIPEFSLPHTSIGTKEAEEYLKTTHPKMYRSIFTEKGMSRRYTDSLAKTLSRGMSRAKAIFTHRGDHTIALQKWFLSAFPVNSPILDCNRKCPDRGCNPVFCSRITILFPGKKSGIASGLHKSDIGHPPDSG